jgi:hypothetical protein
MIIKVPVIKVVELPKTIEITIDINKIEVEDEDD